GFRSSAGRRTGSRTHAVGTRIVRSCPTRESRAWRPVDESARGTRPGAQSVLPAVGIPTPERSGTTGLGACRGLHLPSSSWRGCARTPPSTSRRGKGPTARGPTQELAIRQQEDGLHDRKDGGGGVPDSESGRDVDQSALVVSVSFAFVFR